MNKSLFVYSPKYSEYSFGFCSMNTVKYKYTYELICGYGLNNNIFLLNDIYNVGYFLQLAHSKDYIDMLYKCNDGILYNGYEKYNLDTRTTPVSKGIYDWVCGSVYGTLLACSFLLQGGKRAFNICGGFHHAKFGKASGFCYFNDAVVAIKCLQKLNKKVLYVDIDVHHGDGVQEAFYNCNDVYTVSFHQEGIFPNTGKVDEDGVNIGKGYCLNIPFNKGDGDSEILPKFYDSIDNVLAKFDFDILITQVGVDMLKDDHIGELDLTMRGYENMIKCFSDINKPWLALGGGGYEIHTVARAWTNVWAIMNDVVLNDKLPRIDFVSKYGMEFLYV